jgi:hypothetical protein
MGGMSANRACGWFVLSRNRAQPYRLRYLRFKPAMTIIASRKFTGEPVSYFFKYSCLIISSFISYTISRFALSQLELYGKYKGDNATDSFNANYGQDIVEV